MAEGALDARPRIGYSVKPLTEAEFTQLYDLRPLLDPAALRLAGIPAASRLEELEKLNRKLDRTRDPELVIALDDEWHLALLADCPNRILVGFIENVMLRTRRYELALMREASGPTAASRGHDDILKSLHAGDMDGACEHLERNMTGGRALILGWLKSRHVAGRQRKAK